MFDTLPPFRLTWSRLAIEGQRIPPTHGIAYREVDRDQYVLYPIPFNVLARAVRECYYWCLAPTWGTVDRIAYARVGAHREGYRQGYLDGKRDGFLAGYRA